MDEPKACPFCGITPESAKYGNSQQVIVRCMNNKCWIFRKWTYLEEWQTRPRESALEARVAELEARIAAAPDLYEALNELSDLMQDVIDGEYVPDSFTLQPAHAALTKAQGGE